MAVTLADIQMSTQSKLQKGVINALLNDGGVNGGGQMLRVLPVKTVSTLSPEFAKINTEGNSSTIIFRPIGGAFSEGTIATYRESTDVANVGGDIVIDDAARFDKYLEGLAPQVLQVEYKGKLINRFMNNKAVNGNRALDPYGFDGFKARVTSGQVLQPTAVSSSYSTGMNVTSGGTINNDFITAMDWLSEMIGEGGVLLMNNHAKRAFRRAVRDSKLWDITQDQYGRRIESYMGMQIVNPGAITAAEEFNTATSDTYAVIPNNLTYGGNSKCTQIYAVRPSVDNGVCLLQAEALRTRVVTEEAEAAPYKKIRMSWYASVGVLTKSAIARLDGIQVVP